MLKDLTQLMQIRSTRPMDPVFDTDQSNLVSILLLWTDSCWAPTVNCSTPATILWNVNDFVQDTDLFGIDWLPDTSFSEYVSMLQFMLAAFVLQRGSKLCGDD